MTTRTRPASHVAAGGWSVVVVLVCLITIATVATSSRSATDTAIAAGDLVVFGAAWAAFGRRTFDGGRGWLAFTVLIAVVGFVGALMDPAFATFQTIAYPLVWVTAPTTRLAAPGNLLVALGVGAGYAMSEGGLVGAVLVEIFSLGFSVAMGLWISRITALSEERRVLLEQLTRAQDQVAALHRESGIASERERLARELHDTIAQSLTAIVMLAERAKTQHGGDSTLGMLEETAREALAETRGLVAAGAAVPLDGGLAHAIAVLGERFQRETGVIVTTAVDVEAPRGLEVVLLRCAQEALANIRKHAHAATAEIGLHADGGDVRLVVADDGTGFADDDLDRGFGLAGMRERVALVGGRLTVARGATCGTVLEVRLPAEHAVGARPLGAP